ncbi:MAG: integration host factor subunit alpha [Nitrospirae bacterium]|nr:integration host factor subunit alpha [Nitrospirota bacterium]
MKKVDIANELYEKIGISKKEAMDIVEIVLDTLKDSLKNGETVKIAGFGNFVVRNKRERKGRNPKTGEEIGISPRKVVTFRPSHIFKEYVNGQKPQVESLESQKSE